MENEDQNENSWNGNILEISEVKGIENLENYIVCRIRNFLNNSMNELERKIRIKMESERVKIKNQEIKINKINGKRIYEVAEVETFKDFYINSTIEILIRNFIKELKFRIRNEKRSIKYKDFKNRNMKFKNNLKEDLKC